METEKLREKTRIDIKNTFTKILNFLEKVINQIKEGKIDEDEAYELLTDIHGLLSTLKEQLDNMDLIDRALEKREEH